MKLRDYILEQLAEIVVGDRSAFHIDRVLILQGSSIAVGCLLCMMAPRGEFGLPIV